MATIRGSVAGGRTTLSRGRGGVGISTAATRGATSSGSGAMSLAEYTARLQAQTQESMARAAYSSHLTLDRWMQQQAILLHRQEDEDALDRIGKGDAAYGMTYARQRAAEEKAAGNTKSAAYWDDIAERSTEKAEDMYLQALLKAGEIEPEDLLPILEDRRSKAELGSASFLTLTTNIAQVRESIQSRRVNDYLSNAYAEFIKTNNSKGYLGSLMSVFAQTNDQEIRTALTKQINDMQKRVEEDDAEHRQQIINPLVVAYYGDRVGTPAAKVLFALEEATRRATTSVEANRYITLAQSIVQRETQLAGAAARGGGGGGGSRGGGGGGGGGASAESEQAAAVKANYAAAEKKLKEEILDKGRVPTDAEWAIYWGAGDSRIAEIQRQLGAGVTASLGKTLTTELTALSDDRRTYKEGAASNIVKRSEELEGIIKDALTQAKNANVPEATLFETISGLVSQLHQLRESPFLQGETNQIKEVTENVRGALAPIQSAYDEARGMYNDEGNVPAMNTLKQQYRAYTTEWLNAQPGRAEGGWKPFDEWLGVMLDPNTQFLDKARTLGMTKMVATAADARKQEEVPIETFDPSDVLGVRTALSTAQEEMDRAVVRMRTSFALINDMSPDEMQYIEAGRIARGMMDPALQSDIAIAREKSALGASYMGPLANKPGGSFTGRNDAMPYGLTNDPSKFPTWFGDERLLQALTLDPSFLENNLAAQNPIEAGRSRQLQQFAQQNPSDSLFPGYEPVFTPAETPEYASQFGDSNAGLINPWRPRANEANVFPGYAPAQSSNALPPDFATMFGIQSPATEATGQPVFDPGFVDFGGTDVGQAANDWLDADIDLSAWLPTFQFPELPPPPAYNWNWSTPATEPPAAPMFDPGWSNPPSGGASGSAESTGGPVLTA